MEDATGIYLKCSECGEKIIVGPTRWVGSYDGRRVCEYLHPQTWSLAGVSPNGDGKNFVCRICYQKHAVTYFEEKKALKLQKECNVRRRL